MRWWLLLRYHACVTQMSLRAVLCPAGTHQCDFVSRVTRYQSASPCCRAGCLVRLSGAVEWPSWVVKCCVLSDSCSGVRRSESCGVPVLSCTSCSSGGQRSVHLCTQERSTRPCAGKCDAMALFALPLHSIQTDNQGPAASHTTNNRALHDPTHMSTK